MVFARERSRIPCGEGLGRIQRSDSDRRRWYLRNRAEESAFTELFPRPLQRYAGKRRACVPSDVCGTDEEHLNAEFAKNAEKQNRRLLCNLRMLGVKRLYSDFSSMQVTSSCCGVEPTNKSRSAIRRLSISAGVPMTL